MFKNEDVEGCIVKCIHKDIADKVKHGIISDNEINEISNFFKAFSNETRMKILYALELSELCVCDLAYIIGISESAISHQLSKLKALKLITFRRKGPKIYYQLADNHISMILKIGLEHIREGGKNE